MLLVNRLVMGAICGYLVGILLIWLLLWTTTDRWWMTSLVAYGPRWALLLPLLPLIPVALLDLRSGRWLPLLLAGLTAVIVGVPVMGLRHTWTRPSPEDAAVQLRILTCNVDGDAARLPALGQRIRDHRPRIVALQECGAISTESWPGEWHVERAGQLLLASPYPLRDVRLLERSLPPSRWPPVNGLRAVVDLPEGPVTVCCVHLRTPRFALDQLLSRRTLINLRRGSAVRMETIYRQVEVQEILAWLDDVEGPLLVVGDLNTPPESWLLGKWRRQFSDTFGRVGRGYGYTKITEHWIFRYGTRIDYVLCGPGVEPLRGWVDADIGSDHLPLLADVQWVPSPERSVDVNTRHGSRPAKGRARKSDLPGSPPLPVPTRSNLRTGVDG
jgi:vancomycin resistance protein VanJ